MLHFSIKSFSELTLTQLYELLKLRNEVFIVEQACAYPDLDDKDQNALHVLGIENGQMVAYARLLAPGDGHAEAGIGRVLTAVSARKLGYGKQLMATCITETKNRFKTHEIVISAQLYLKQFYTELGFMAEGEGYLEDDIPHIKMRLHAF